MDRVRSHILHQKEIRQMTQQETRRKFSKQFKIDAVELLMQSEKSALEIGMSLGVRPELLYRWKSEYLATQASPFPGSGHLKDPEEERFRKLELELCTVTEEREILKKALAVFSRTTI